MATPPWTVRDKLWELIEPLLPSPRKLPSGSDIDRWLPWSHIALSKFKSWTLDIFHGVSPGHL